MVLRGHEGPVHLVKYTQDGSRILSLGDGVVRIWDAASGRFYNRLNGQEEHVSGFTTSADGSQIITYSTAKTTRIWDLASGSLVRGFRSRRASITDVAWSANGKWVVSCSNSLSDADWEAVVFRLNVNQDALLSNGQFVDVWDAETGRILQRIHGFDGVVSGVMFSPCSSMIAICKHDTIYIWHINDRCLVRSIPGHRGAVSCAAFSPDGTRIASADSEAIWVWDVLSGKELCRLHRHDYFKGYTTVAFSPDGTLLASGARDRTVRVWNIASGKQLRCLRGHDSDVKAVTFSPDGARIASCSLDHTVRIWDVNTGIVLRSIDSIENDINWVVYSRDLKHLAFVVQAKHVRVCDADTGEHLHWLSGDGGDITSIKFSTDQKWIAALSDKKAILIWDTSTGKRHRFRREHGGNITRLVISPTCTQIVAAYTNSTVQMWDIASGKEGHCLLTEVGDRGTVKYSSDGHELMTDSGETCRIWDVKSGKELRRLNESERFRLINPFGRALDDIFQAYANEICADDISCCTDKRCSEKENVGDKGLACYEDRFPDDDFFGGILHTGHSPHFRFNSAQIGNVLVHKASECAAGFYPIQLDVNYARRDGRQWICEANQRMHIISLEGDIGP